MKGRERGNEGFPILQELPRLRAGAPAEYTTTRVDYCLIVDRGNPTVVRQPKFYQMEIEGQFSQRSMPAAFQNCGCDRIEGAKEGVLPIRNASK